MSATLTPESEALLNDWLGHDCDVPFPMTPERLALIEVAAAERAVAPLAAVLRRIAAAKDAAMPESVNGDYSEDYRQGVAWGLLQIEYALPGGDFWEGLAGAGPAPEAPTDSEWPEDWLTEPGAAPPAGAPEVSEP